MIKDSYICGGVIQEKKKVGGANDVENKYLDYFEVIFTPHGPKEVS